MQFILHSNHASAGLLLFSQGCGGVHPFGRTTTAAVNGEAERPFNRDQDCLSPPISAFSPTAM
jgi:hypothetical protein